MLKVKPSIGNLNLDRKDDDNRPITVIVDASGLTITKKDVCQRFHHYSYPVISSPSTTATTTLHVQDLLYCLE